jgi:Transposase DDE domain
MARKQRKERSSQKSVKARKAKSRVTNAESLRKARDWLFPDASIFAKVRLHGNITWTPTNLVMLALCWSWSESRHVTDAFADASGWCESLLGHSPLTTYQGFMGALATWTSHLLPILIGVLHQGMAGIGGKFYRLDGWVPIAFDGSRSSASRTKANEQEFCAKNYGQGKTAKYRKKKSKGLRRKRNKRNPGQPQEPQTWITMLWHMALRLPWNWRLGPSNASERDHVIEMVQQGHFPAHTLLCGDAGFVGYRLWSCFQQANLKFLVRVGGNVNLLSEHALCKFETIEKENYVLCWPKEAVRTDLPPLRLRLVHIYVGKTLMWLLTNELDWQELTTKMMARFYTMRWGVEVEFRGLKQTLNRGKLRCRNSKRVLAELHWSILAMAVAELLALKEQLQNCSTKKQATEEPTNEPNKRSLASTMRAIRGCLKKLEKTPDPGKDLASMLREAVVDSYQRTSSKKARYRPPNPDKKPLGDPAVRKLNQEENERLKRLECKKTA